MLHCYIQSTVLGHFHGLFCVGTVTVPQWYQCRLALCCLSWGLGQVWLGVGLGLNKVRVDGYTLGAVVGLVNTDQAVSQLKHVRPEGDDDELGIPGPLLNVVCHYGDILEIQGSVNLVHHVEWCWLK